MGKKLLLSEIERSRIVVLSKEGYSEREISAKIRRSKAAVHTVIANFNNCGSYKDLNRSGRFMKTSPRGSDDKANCCVLLNKFESRLI